MPIIKELVLYLASTGADTDVEDSSGNLPVDRANGKAKDAFLELQGLRFEGYDRYEGDLNADQKKNGVGREIIKKEGYHEVEMVLYEGSFKDGVRHGQGVLYHLRGKIDAHFTANDANDAGSHPFDVPTWLGDRNSWSNTIPERNQ